MKQRTVLMDYHREPEGWWADSPGLPGFSAAGATLEEVGDQAHEGARFYLDEPVQVEDRVPADLGTPRGKKR